MSYNEQIAVEIYEKKFSLENLNWMYQEGRLHFPHLRKLNKYQDTVPHLIDAIQIGIPMPVIYASELQNGDYLILESKERLRALLEYLQESFSVHMNETPPYNTNRFFHELSQENPRLASMIFRTIFFFRSLIIIRRNIFTWRPPCFTKNGALTENRIFEICYIKDMGLKI